MINQRKQKARRTRTESFCSACVVETGGAGEEEKNGGDAKSRAQTENDKLKSIKE